MNGKKWAMITLISIFDFLSPLSANIMAPALPMIAEEFKIQDRMVQQLLMSIFVLGWAVRYVPKAAQQIDTQI